MFEFTLSATEALLLKGFFVSVVVPFLVSWLKRCSWPKSLKFALALVISAFGGVLTLYGDGALTGGSLLVAALAVFTASQVWFATWFQGLGFERLLNPDQPLPAADLAQAADDKASLALESLAFLERGMLASHPADLDVPPVKD